jgi:acetyltransferase-like isoleucine patch superfamily enzyme
VARPSPTVQILGFFRFVMTRWAGGIKRTIRAFQRELEVTRLFGELSPRIDERASIVSLSGLRLGKNVQIRRDAEIILPEPGPTGEPQATISLGNDVRVGQRVQLGVQPGAHLTVGDNSSLQAGCVILGDVAIGSNCLFSLHVFISSGNHFSELRPAWLIRDQDRLAHESPEFEQRRSAPVTIEDDCWLGWGSIVKRGVYVGKGAIIGSYSLVTKDVPPYSVQAGTPSRELRKRLHFCPPSSVDATRQEDHPYFYSGFLLNQEELTRYGNSRGVALQGRKARILLAGDSYDEISLIGTLEQQIGSVNCKLFWNRCEIQQTTLTGPDFEVRAHIPGHALTDATRQSLPSPLRGFHELSIELERTQVTESPRATGTASTKAPQIIESECYLRVHSCSAIRRVGA